MTPLTLAACRWRTTWVRPCLTFFASDLLKRLDADIAELDGIVVTGKAKVAGLQVLAGVRLAAHEFLHRRQVGVEDHIAVQLHLDLRALDGDFLEVPLTDRALKTSLARHHAV